MKNIIIDTDIGDDIDDALAIVCAMQHPDIQVEGITTSFRNANKRAILAEKLANDYCTYNIPIYQGISQPFINKVDEDSPQFKLVGNEERTYGNAVSFILKKVEENKNTKIIGIGPLTNIAAAIKENPKLFSGRELYIMGGMLGQAYPEWNIRMDPEAAHIVFMSGMKIYVTGLDLTMQTILKEEEILRLKKIMNHRKTVLSEMYEIWESGSLYHPILHDVLAIMGIFDEKVVKYREACIQIETSGNYTRGLMVERKKVFPDEVEYSANCYYGESFDRDMFINCLFTYIK